MTTATSHDRRTLISVNQYFALFIWSFLTVQAIGFRSSLISYTYWSGSLAFGTARCR